MIILDIETTGLTSDYGIYELGAINLDYPMHYFLQNCRIDLSDIVTEGALKVNGKTIQELNDSSKQSQKQLLENYLFWVEKQPEKIFFGQNVGWDITMIQSKAIKYNIHDMFLNIHGQRGFDLHTISQDKYKDIHGKYYLDDKGKSLMKLGKTLEFCGIQDNRVKIFGNKVVKEGEFHNALEDCKLEGEALIRLKFGINLFPEYAHFKIPDYLKKIK